MGTDRPRPNARGPVVGVHGRRGHRDFHGLRRARTQVRKLTRAEESPAANLSGHRDRDRAPLDRAVEPEPVHLIGRDVLEAIGRLHDLTRKDVAALLAVRHDVNGNGKTDLTQDGGGVSNNPAINVFNLGKPSYDKAAFQVNGVRSITINMRYM